ncbi:MAG: MCE family protein [Candidatus Hydrogenedentes bacterium]|nr:MCE family protein [Candidatus Hydrogenedentota bacterium]
MATPKQKFKVSIFLLFCIGIMVGGTLVVTGIYQTPGLRYWLEFEESILGLYEGGMVEYLGVPVGKVQEIHVTPNQLAHVEIMINPKKVTLHDGVQGKLVIYSIAAGTMAISLSGGNPENEPLPEFSLIPCKTSVIEAFSSQLTTILEDLSSTLKDVSVIGEKVRIQVEGLEDTTVQDIMNGVRNIVNKGDAFVSNTDTLVEETTEAVRDFRGHANTLVETISERSQDLERLFKKLESLAETYTSRGEELKVDELQQNLNKLLEQMDSTVANMETIAGDMMHKAGNVEYTLRGTLTDLGDSLESVRILVNQLKDDPSALIRGRGRIQE